MTSVTSDPTVVAGWLAGRGQRNGRWSGARGRRSVPHLLLGVLLVLACTVGFLLVVLNTGGRRPVLVLARPVAVGHVLAAQDVRRVELGVDDAVSVVGADDAATVLGRPVATSLPAGTVLTPGVVGSPLLPGPGRAVVAVAVKPGQLPTEAAPGSSVVVVAMTATATGVTATDAAGSGVTSPPVGGWPAVVTSIQASPNDQVTLVSLELADTAAREVAALPAGQVSIVLLPGGA